ncbi:conserved hypothetical protein [Candidatus Brocadia pituitae]|nr:conserved hypothetical protein [Candidatus Brocadia pituitae]
MKLINFVSPLHFKKYRYRCSICNKDLLVNETIVDTGIGMAKFNNEFGWDMLSLSISLMENG